MEKKTDSQKRDTTLSAENLKNVQGGKGLRETNKEKTTPISEDTKRKI